MLSFIRRFTKSRLGLIVVFIVLGIIALAFGMGDITGLRANGGAGSGTALVKVGSRELTESELRQRINVALSARRRQGQPITMEQFLAAGGLEQVLEQNVAGLAVEEFARMSGIVMSSDLIDGQIASMPAFQGVDGKFSQKRMEELLGGEGLTPRELREDVARVQYGRWLLDRTVRSTQIPEGLVTPYTAMMLERRTGIAGMVRSIDMDPGPDPDDKALAAFYNANRARYLVPQRRTLRYAIVQPEQFRAQSAATEAEIADAFAKSGTRYAATEKRTLRQLVLADQAAATNVANQVKGGQSIAAAASAAGLEARTFDAIEKAVFARETSPAVADAAFAAAEGSVIGPVRSPLGWQVLQVEKIDKIAARTLDQARAELATELGQRKLITALVALRQKIEDEIGNDATFDEVIAETKLQAQRTPALVADGTNPDDAASKPDPLLAPIVGAGFRLDPEIPDPELVAVGQEGGFAVVALDRVTPAAPRPLAGIREAVKKDYLLAEALKKARALAANIVKEVDKGVPLAQALAAAGIRNPPPKAFDMKRTEIVGRDTPAHVTMAFSMKPGQARLVEGPERSGYYIVWLERAEMGNATGDATLAGQIRTGLGQQLGAERAEQLLEAIKRSVKIQRNEAALARFKASLVGGSASR